MRQRHEEAISRKLKCQKKYPPPHLTSYSLHEGCTEAHYALNTTDLGKGPDKRFSPQGIKRQHCCPLSEMPSASKREKRFRLIVLKPKTFLRRSREWTSPASSPRTPPKGTVGTQTPRTSCDCQQHQSIPLPYVDRGPGAARRRLASKAVSWIAATASSNFIGGRRDSE